MHMRASDAGDRTDVRAPTHGIAGRAAGDMGGTAWHWN
jgi:hypothetical protein